MVSSNIPLQNIYNTYMFAGITIYGHSDHKTNITIEFASKKLLQNIYNIYMFAGITVHSYSDHRMDITFEFTSKNHSRSYITFIYLPVLPYMVTPITEWTSPLNSHQKNPPDYI